MATIDEAVRIALHLAGTRLPILDSSLNPEELELISREKAAWSAGQKYLRGIFAGGTFCYQAQQILRDMNIAIHSNAPFEMKYELKDSNYSLEHTIVDMGADEYTVGRPHPMIDGTLRKKRILTESHDPEIAILLLDFILGYNASMDPVGELFEAILEARENVKKRGGSLTVVASVCGTDGDPQDFELQTKLLKEAGVIVFRSNARAVVFCCELLK